MFGTLWVALWPWFCLQSGLVLSHSTTVLEWPCLMLMFSEMVSGPAGGNIAQLWAPSQRLMAMGSSVSDRFQDATLMWLLLCWFDQFRGFCFQWLWFSLTFKRRKRSDRKTCLHFLGTPFIKIIYTQEQGLPECAWWGGTWMSCTGWTAIWTFRLQRHALRFSVILLRNRITCLWFCNKKEALFVPDRVYISPK